MFAILERVAVERLDLVSIFIEPACHIVFSHRRLTGDFRPSLTSQKSASGKKATPPHHRNFQPLIFQKADDSSED